MGSVAENDGSHVLQHLPGGIREQVLWQYSGVVNQYRQRALEIKSWEKIIFL